MSDDKKVEDGELADVSGGSGVLSHLAQDDGSGAGSEGAEIGQSPGGGGNTGQDAEGGGGGNENLGS